MTKPRFKRRPQRSLRTILVIWFLIVSIVPVAFITGYSVIKYEKSLDRELWERLNGNAREISAVFNDYKINLETRKNKYLTNPSFVYSVSTSDMNGARQFVRAVLPTESSTSMSIFNKEGRMLWSASKQESGEIADNEQIREGAIYLSEANLQKLRAEKEYVFVDYLTSQRLSLVYFSKIFTSTGKHVGYLEQAIDLDKRFLDNLGNRMKLELILLKASGQVVAATNPDFLLYKKDFFNPYVQPDSNAYFDLNIRGSPHAFVMYPLHWGHSELYIALGVSKGQAREVLKTVNYAFYSVVGTMIVFLVIVTVFASNSVLKPLDDLVEAIEIVQSSDRPIEIPIKNDTEIGLLTESFNELSRNIIQARTDLRKKISELESANHELVETQAKLVHNSKMISLGLLVAGVAHELNNPIGFIYSNMMHLKDYSEKLIDMIKTAEESPEHLQEKIKDYDLEYIKKDLPKLILSCQEGARRTRDIVIGLRNFSRLDEAKLKEVDIHEIIENTLNLLTGELKNRIQVHKTYGVLPKVQCFESQISQVLMNILTNGAQAIEGSGNIWITTSSFKVGNEEKIQISIQDSGKGMTPEVAEKIFDPFFSTKDVGQGTGLGLSISYGIIQNHNGEIQVKTKLGMGTEFVIIIPANPQIKKGP